MSWSGWLDRAQTLLGQGSLEEAEAAVLTAVEEGADPGEAYELLGAVYLEQCRPELAVNAATKAVDHDPDRAGAYRHLARAHQLLGHPEAAFAALLAAIERHPEALGCYIDAALLLRDAADIDQALDLLDEARRQIPRAGGELARVRLDLLLWDHRWADAAGLARSLLADHPDDLKCLDALVTACSREGDLPRAIAAAEKLLVACPGAPEHALRLAGLLREDGQLQRAVRLYQHLAETWPETPEGRDARDALALIDGMQLQTAIILAADSALFRRQILRDPWPAVAARGLALSREGLTALLALLHDLDPPSGGEAVYH